MANKTTTVVAKHPYPTYLWRHQPTGGEWQNADQLSGYVSGMNTPTLELSGATAEESGLLGCTISNPAGASTISDLVALVGGAEAPVITNGITDKIPYEGESAVYGPITVTGTPTPTLLWEAETADGNNTWADADTVFGADGSGQGTDTYTVANTVPTDNRDIRVTATNAAGSAVSQAALTVTPKLAFVSAEPTDKTIIGKSLWFTSVEPTDKTVSATESTPQYLHDFARGNPITLGGFNGTPTNGVYTDPPHRDSLASGADDQGVIQEVIDNVPVIIGASLTGNIWSSASGTQGLQLEESRTNDCLYSNDFTNAAWVKSGVTVNGTQITATGANGTITQTVTAASAERTVSFFISRVTGTGTVEISSGGGVWTAVTISGTGAYYSHTSTQTNPVIGIRLGTSGDVIDVQIAQLEAGAFGTSGIVTAGTPVTRAATNCIGTFAQLGDPLPAGGVTNDYCLQLVFTLNSSWADAEQSRIFFNLNADDSLNNYIQFNRSGANSSRCQTKIANTNYNIDINNSALGNIQAGDVIDIRMRKSLSAGVKIWWNINGTPVVSGENLTATGAHNNPIAHAVINGDAFDNIPYFAMTVHQLRIVPEALSDEDIEAWPAWSPPT